MKKFILALALATAAYFGLRDTGPVRATAGPPATQALLSSQPEALHTAISQQKSGTQITGAGIVTKVLADDNQGSRHQRFIVTLATGQTLLIAHNIDLAPRLELLKAGDAVEFSGVYEWNAKGGVIHWTHRDPNGRHQAGWLRHAGQTYQ